MKDHQMNKSLKRLISMTYVVMVMVMLILLFNYVFPILGELLNFVPSLLMPLIVAIVLAALMEPLVSWLDKYIGRLWATLASFVLVLGGFALFISMIAVVAVKQIGDLYEYTMKHSDQIIALTMQSVSSVQLFFVNLNIPPEARTFIENALTNGAASLKDLLSSMAQSLGSGISSVPEALLFILIAAIATFFVIKDQTLLIAFLEKTLPDSAMEKASIFTNQLFDTLRGWIRGYAILTMITAVITVISLTFLGIESAFMIGIIIAICDIIPVVGSGFIFIPWVIVNIVMGNPLLGAELLVLWIGVGVVRQMSEPKIVGDNIGLHPLASLLSLYVGVKLAGFIGMILGPITLVIVLSMARGGLFDPLFPWLNIPVAVIDEISSDEGAIPDEQA